MTVPVYLIAGFLGSGKTTLLKRMVEYMNANGQKPLVLMNEFGETNIDSELLEGSRAQMRELIDGCICCTSKADLSRALYQIATQDKPSAILLEATGLADPIEVLDICTLPNLLEHLTLRTIISVVDAKRHGAAGVTPQITDLMRRQAKYADVVLLNKTDLVDGARVDALRKELRDLNKRGTLHTTVRSEVDVAPIFQHAASGVTRDKHDHSHCDHDHGHCEHEHEHEHEHHDHAHHHDHVHNHGHEQHHEHEHSHDNFLSMTLWPRGVAARDKLERFLKDGAPGLLRLKGFLHVAGLEPQAVLQWTAGDWELLPLPKTMKPKKDVLVFIGEELDRDAIRARLAACGLDT